MAEACILVVEDEPLLRELIAGELRDSGFVVIEATSAPDAIERMAAHPEIDLLFTDILLGGGANGWDVAIAFRGLYPDRPVIYASAYAPGVPRRVPASVYFDKPYLPLQVVQAVRLLLASRPAAAAVRRAPGLAAVPPPAEGEGDTVDVAPDPSPS
ncbi:response regulator [Salinarimonas soli]|uniref:Response regulator n=1 Tax=Salinarimonas soli TaxID=1638099 RepID=A0A5B2VJD4_9HYPH|nr:response regulator [Salinarimonas soli]KAA2238327.1 response regulator [Salinarimonas soli]